MTSPYQILDEHIHTIADMFCSKWISHHISHRYDIALRNPFSQSKSMIVYIYNYINILLTTSQRGVLASYSFSHQCANFAWSNTIFCVI
jgi:hypothetical protein